METTVVIGNSLSTQISGWRTEEESLREPANTKEITQRQEYGKTKHEVVQELLKSPKAVHVWI